MLLGRITLGVPFLIIGIALIPYWNQTTPLLSSLNVPVPAILLLVGAALAILGALSLILGYKARIGSILLMIPLIAATFTVGTIWTPTRLAQPATLWTIWPNIAIFGGLLYLLTFGPGSISLDLRKRG